MIRVGITGQAGFIGSHLYNYLGLKENIIRIPFEDVYFDDKTVLAKFIKECDVIIHLAALNRHHDPNQIYNTNIKLVTSLIEGCKESNSKPYIIFSSSSQEERNNLYGKSKLDGRLLFEKWAMENRTKFTAMVIPNVFGPFGQPYYNSVVSTFSYQLSHAENPQIQTDAELDLIYINELIDEFYNKICKINNNKESVEIYKVPHSTTKKVSEILNVLEFYTSKYFIKGEIPNIENRFELALFNTFRSYFDANTFPRLLMKNTDQRGSFIETVRTENKGQFSYSTTKPGITRGNHYHTRKVERFIVIEGKAEINLRRIGSDNIISYELDGEQPSYIDIPIWYTHNIINIGNKDLVTLFWINESYNPNDTDTYFEDV